MEDLEKIRLPWSDWKIVKKLGSGAYGKVYEIERNISGVQEKAALKIVSRPKDDSEIETYYDEGYDKASIAASYEKEIRNYVQEYRLMKALKGQTNIVSCDDFTVVPHENGIGGDVFIRMELLMSLQQVLRQKRLSEREIIKLGKDISTALILCERKNIVHRDIKPANIMVSEFGDYELGDFGVSKIMSHTTYATVMGTPEYEAPEVIHGGRYGKTADIYSLGITLYWLLNERKMPFIDADEELIQLTSELRSNAMKRRYSGEKLPAPKNGSEELKQIVLKACEYRPEDRYASAQEMYDVLDEIGSGKSYTKNTVYGYQTELSSEDDEMENGKTIGKTMEEFSDVQTGGNSWGKTGETIGKPGGPSGQNNDKGHLDVTDPGTSGVKDAYKKQQKKEEAAKKVVAEKKEEAKKVVTAESKPKKVKKRDNKSKIAKYKWGKVVIIVAVCICGVLLAKNMLEKDPDNFIIDRSNYKETVDDNGNVVQRTYYYKTGRIGEICEYDENGKMTKETDYYTNGKGIREVTEYNENEEKIKWSSYDNGKVRLYWTYEYDEKGNNIKATRYDENDKVEIVQECEYDENGNQVKKTHYDSEGQLVEYQIFEYDSDNNKTKETNYDSDGNVKTYTIYENGESLKSTTYDADGKAI